MQPVPIFSATGGDPLVWSTDTPSSTPSSRRASARTGSRSCCGFSTGAPRRSAPRNASCASTAWRASTSPGTPTAPGGHRTGPQEIANQYGFIGGRVPAFVSKPRRPTYVKDLLTYSNEYGQVPGEGPVGRASSWRCRPTTRRFNQPTEDKITDVVRGRRPISDLDTIVKEWRSTGGDEGRELIAKGPVGQRSLTSMTDQIVDTGSGLPSGVGPGPAL